MVDERCFETDVKLQARRLLGFVGLCWYLAS